MRNLFYYIAVTESQYKIFVFGRGKFVRNYGSRSSFRLFIHRFLFSVRCGYLCRSSPSNSSIVALSTISRAMIHIQSFCTIFCCARLEQMINISRNFSSQSHFSRTFKKFKKYTNSLPNESRKRHGY